VVHAVQARVALATAFTLPTVPELELAEAIASRAPRLEQLRFSNSGSEAVMCAIKASRAITGRTAIVKMEGTYHGSYDHAEVSLDLSPRNGGDEHQLATGAHVAHFDHRRWTPEFSRDQGRFRPAGLNADTPAPLNRSRT
jgi:glutamate-1-semialdehyde aminotransferase